jgi:hypothetical protein
MAKPLFLVREIMDFRLGLEDGVTMVLKTGEIKKINLLILIFVLIIVVVMLLLYFFNFSPTINEMENQSKYRRPGENALGFRIGTPYVDGREVFMITEIESNGSMGNAGGKEKDIILDKTIGEFFKEIYQHREDKYSFKVEREGALITITVDVPYYEI